MQAGTVSRPFGALFIMIFMPFALGYVVQQFFRSINAVIASRLVTDLNLDAAQLGLLTSMFFLGASAAQLPVGALIDRLGPGRTQAMLLVLATAGAALFSIASDPQTAMLGRLLIGIGVAATLPTGMKAIVLWFPKARVGLLNGLFIAIGTLGAIATSVPAEWVLASYSWRDIFVWMAIASAAMSCLMMFAIPRAPQSAQAPASVASGFRQIITDRRFWRVAPASSLVVASAWSLSLLWVSPWLRDVDGASQLDISAQLLVLTVAQCLGALGLGIVVDRLRGRGIGPDRVLMGIAGLLITGEMAIYFAWAPGRALAWTAIGIVCATNVVSFTVTAELFEKEILGRANGALNLLHLSTTFAVQALFGVVIALWPRDAAGHYPPEAYYTALMGLVALQVAALLWLMVPATRSIPTREAKSATRERHAFQNGWLRPAALCGLGMLIGWKAGPLAEMQADRLLHIEIPRIGMVKAASLPEGTSDIFQAVSAVREEMSRQRALLDALHSSLDSLGHRLAAKEQPAQEMSGPDKLRPREQTAAEAQPPRSSAIGFCSADTSRTLVLPFDRYEEKLSERHRASLEDEIASLPCPPRGIRINGYTDNRGTPEQNERLSRQRAALVAELLRDKGVRTDRLEIHALGARNAIADNDTVDGRARNRRVEVVFEF